MMSADNSARSGAHNPDYHYKITIIQRIYTAFSNIFYYNNDFLSALQNAMNNLRRNVLPMLRLFAYICKNPD